MGSVFPRGRRLYAKIQDVAGRWRQRRTDFVVGQEADALKWVAQMEREVAAARGYGTDGPLTVRRYFSTWIKKRKTKTVRDDKTRIEKHALPVIGDLPLNEVRPRHLRDLIMALRHGGELAPKTIREVSGVLHTMFKSAVVDDLIPSNPVVYERGVLPKKIDKDPTWRSQAIFTRGEVEQIITDTRLPFDRRMVYALKFFTGRHSEVADLTWSQYDAHATPLHALHLGYTKGGIPRSIPVHPVLARMLEVWRTQGWREFYGRDPKPSDRIVTTRAGRRKKADETQKQFVKDLDAIGLRTTAGKSRRRRGHDLRRTLITLARSDGASDALLRWITHGPKANEILDTYSTPPWEALCGTIAKLRISVPRGAVWCSPRRTISRAPKEAVYKRPRRDSNPVKVPSGDTQSECGRAVTLHDVTSGASPLHQAVVQPILTTCDVALAMMRA